jgi:hypothetical protein
LSRPQAIIPSVTLLSRHGGTAPPCFTSSWDARFICSRRAGLPDAGNRHHVGRPNLEDGTSLRAFSCYDKNRMVFYMRRHADDVEGPMRSARRRSSGRPAQMTPSCSSAAISVADNPSQSP